MGNGSDHDGRMPSDVCDDVRPLMRNAKVSNTSWRPRPWHHDTRAGQRAGVESVGVAHDDGHDDRGGGMAVARWCRAGIRRLGTVLFSHETSAMKARLCRFVQQATAGVGSPRRGMVGCLIAL